MSHPLIGAHRSRTTIPGSLMRLYRQTRRRRTRHLISRVRRCGSRSWGGVGREEGGCLSALMRNRGRGRGRCSSRAQHARRSTVGSLVVVLGVWRGTTPTRRRSSGGRVSVMRRRRAKQERTPLRMGAPLLRIGGPSRRAVLSMSMAMSTSTSMSTTAATIKGRNNLALPMFEGGRQGRISSRLISLAMSPLAQVVVGSPVGHDGDEDTYTHFNCDRFSIVMFEYGKICVNCNVLTVPLPSLSPVYVFSLEPRFNLTESSVFLFKLF